MLYKIRLIIHEQPPQQNFQNIERNKTVKFGVSATEVEKKNCI